MNESRHLLHRGSAFSSTLPSLFGGCDEEDLATMTEEVAISDGYDVAVFVQVCNFSKESYISISKTPYSHFWFREPYH